MTLKGKGGLWSWGGQGGRARRSRQVPGCRGKDRRGQATRHLRDIWGPRQTKVGQCLKMQGEQEAKATLMTTHTLCPIPLEGRSHHPHFKNEGTGAHRCQVVLELGSWWPQKRFSSYRPVSYTGIRSWTGEFAFNIWWAGFVRREPHDYKTANTDFKIKNLNCEEKGSFTLVAYFLLTPEALGSFYIRKHFHGKWRQCSRSPPCLPPLLLPFTVFSDLLSTSYVSSIVWVSVLQ